MPDKKEKKNKKVEVLCTEKQLKIIREKALSHGMSVSEYGLFTMLNAHISVSIGGDPLLSSINKLITMLDRGKISEEEFELLKKRLLETG